MLGGPALSRQGARAVPSLTYLERQPNFSIGPDDPANETVNLAQKAEIGQQTARAQKIATQTRRARPTSFRRAACSGTAAPTRCRTQAPVRCSIRARWMAAASRSWPESCATRLMPESFAELFGEKIFEEPQLLVAEAMFAVARYQIEEPSFHPYTSKYDYWLEGKARLSESEMRGYQSVQRSGKGQLRRLPYLRSRVRDGLPPLFTDHQYEALAAPRNAALADNKDPELFRSRGLRPSAHRHRRSDAILRHVHDTDLAQHRDAPRLLPQWRIPDAASR